MSDIQIGQGNVREQENIQRESDFCISKASDTSRDLTPGFTPPTSVGDVRAV